MPWVSLIIREKCLPVKNYCVIVAPSMIIASSFRAVTAYAGYSYAWRYWVNAEEASAAA